MTAIVTDQFEKYTRKLLRDRTAVPDSIRFYRLDDSVTASIEDEWLPVFSDLFKELNITALLCAKPSIPFADYLVERADPATDKLAPRDSETKIFLHDIPFIRKSEWQTGAASELGRKIAGALKERKAVIIQDFGVVATGAVTVEQAYIAFSSIFHTTFVKYLLDLLTDGFRLHGEKETFESFWQTWLKTPDLSDLKFSDDLLDKAKSFGPQRARQIIEDEICTVGRATVEKGFVDSFFGNISFFDGHTIFISQTASSLDELQGHIDPVPLDYSSTAGLSASSELPAHRGIYKSTDYHAVLHGHPRFSVVMSMYCEEKNCSIDDCNRFCSRKRYICGVPIVAGETGAGGLAVSVPSAIKETGVCIVYGHGVFSAGRKDFVDAFQQMSNAENLCKEEYFRLLKKKTGV